MSANGKSGPDHSPVRLRRVLVSVALFGVSFGYIEAAVVVYLRALYDPVRIELNPGAEPGELFPLIQPHQLTALDENNARRLATELGREVATILLLVAFALAAGHNFRERFAVFVMTFGLWDVFYYVFLKLLLGWPASVLTWDILFLIPVPWTGPVLAPLLVAVSMVVCGLLALWRESVGRPLVLGSADWLAVVLGGVLIVAACCWDYRHVSAGGMPNPFNWPLLAAGELIGLGGFVHAWRRRTA